MRVTLVSQEYPPETAKGGIGTQTHAKAHGLAALGHEVTVISRSVDGRRSESRDGPVTVVRVPPMGPVAHTEVADWLGYSTAVAVELDALHARWPMDLAEFPEWGCEGYVYLVNQTLWHGLVTPVVQLHGPLVMLAHTVGWPKVNSEFYRTGTHMEGTCLRLADAVYSSSACSAEWCARHYGLDRAAVPVMHAGVDVERFAPTAAASASAKDGRPTIVFAGKVTWNKGVRTLLEAACEVAQRGFPGLRLRLLGRAEEQVASALRARAAERGLADMLEMPGFIAREDLPAELAKADIFAAPSEYEGGPGFVYLEAMACGLPAIACEGSGASEVIVPGVNGLLVPRGGDVRTLAAALHGLLADPDARRAMGERARRYVLEEADSRTCIERIADFYATVIERHRMRVVGIRFGLVQPETAETEAATETTPAATTTTRPPQS